MMLCDCYLFLNGLSECDNFIFKVPLQFLGEFDNIFHVKDYKKIFYDKLINIEKRIKKY